MQPSSFSTLQLRQVLQHLFYNDRSFWRLLREKRGQHTENSSPGDVGSSLGLSGFCHTLRFTLGGFAKKSRCGCWGAERVVHRARVSWYSAPALQLSRLHPRDPVVHKGTQDGLMAKG